MWPNEQTHLNVHLKLAKIEQEQPRRGEGKPLHAHTGKQKDEWVQTKNKPSKGDKQRDIVKNSEKETLSANCKDQSHRLQTKLE
mmetsp:Transcript_49083/g.96783  ORF Transcript_49083/g.96783 Transcript_49083/m.96783 type:complete len:84 (+) Transcript_49083:69-320(+)